MNAIVIEHVPVEELPEAWRARLGQIENARVTVRIEQEMPPAQPQPEGDASDGRAF